MEQNYYSPPTPGASDNSHNPLSIAAAGFSKNIQDATANLVAAAQQFSAMSAGLNDAVEEVKAASTRAQQAQAASDAVQAKMERDYGNLNTLIQDLQKRIGALATLARPLSSDFEPATEAEASSGNQFDESAPQSNENPPARAGSWQGWKGE